MEEGGGNWQVDPGWSIASGRIRGPLDGLGGPYGGEGKEENC